jgi:hypothetical protein
MDEPFCRSHSHSGFLVRLSPDATGYQCETAAEQEKKGRRLGNEVRRDISRAPNVFSEKLWKLTDKHRQ